MPVHLATMLQAELLSTLVQEDEVVSNWWRSYRKLKLSERQQLLLEVLHDVGLDQGASEAVAGVDRSRFVPPGSEDLAFLNATIPIRQHSALSPPGLVALMVQMLSPDPGSVVVELGSGTGYHLACFDAYDSTLRLIGVEVDAELAALASDLDARNRSAVGPDSVPADRFYSDDARSFKPPVRPDHVYSTFASNEFLTFPAVRDCMKSVLYVRPLTRAEFESEPPTSWLRDRFEDFNDYLSSDWESYCCLQFDGFGVGLGTAEVYDVRFVPQTQPGFGRAAGEMPAAFTALLET